jgi:hypothetical protein
MTKKKTMSCIQALQIRIEKSLGWVLILIFLSLAWFDAGGYSTVFDFQRKTTYARGAICVIDIYIFWLLGVQGVQKCKPRRATPPGGGVSLGVVWEKFWDIKNVASGHDSLSFEFQASRSYTTPGAVWRRCKITPNTPLSGLRAFETRKFLSSSPVGNEGELRQLPNIEKS